MICIHAIEDNHLIDSNNYKDHQAQEALNWAVNWAQDYGKATEAPDQIRQTLLQTGEFTSAAQPNVRISAHINRDGRGGHWEPIGLEQP